MLPTQIFDERDLLKYIGKKWGLGKFGKVYRISTFNISPDIDLLNINKQENTVTGYEFKMIKYHRGWKRPNIKPLFTGIGQALSYFQFGIDQSYVVFGLSPEIPEKIIPQLINRIDELATVFNRFRRLAESFKSQVFPFKPLEINFTGTLSRLQTGLGCLGIYVWDSHSDTLTCKLRAEEGFPIGMDRNLMHWHNCLLRKEFKCKLEI